jgi:hypothetical protein
MQTSYSINQAAKIAGQVMTIAPKGVDSAIADVAIGFGLGVVQGAKANSVALPTASGDTFMGVALHKYVEQGYPYASAAAAGYAIKDVINLGRRVRFCGVTDGAVTANAVAYVVSSGADAGKFTTTSSSNIATGGKFRETLLAAGIAEIEINLP